MSIVSELKKSGIDSAVITRKGNIKEHSVKIDDPVLTLLVNIVNRLAVVFEQMKDVMEEIVIETASSKVMLIPFGEEFLVAFVKTEQDKKVVRETVGANVH